MQLLCNILSAKSSSPKERTTTEQLNIISVNQNSSLIQNLIPKLFQLLLKIFLNYFIDCTHSIYFILYI